MEQAIGYIRVSTDKQDFERQRDEVMLYAKKMDFAVTKIFEDKQSGSDYDDRGGFQDLLIYLDEHPHIKIIIFDEISRMGRDTAMQVTTYKALTRKGIRVFTRGKGEFGSNKEDNLLFTVLSAIADYEKQTIIDRTSSGRKKVVRDGFTQMSHRPFGYNIILTKKKDRDVEKRQFVEINEEEAVHIRKLFEIVSKNGTTNDCIRYLNENHVKTRRGGVWRNVTLNFILHNTTYYGEWHFGKFVKNFKTKNSHSKRPKDQLIAVKVPAIISKELFDLVQEKMTENRIKYNPKNQKQLFVFKGILECYCGGIMGGTEENRTNRRLYRCPERNVEGIFTKTCPMHFIKADYLESIILSELKEKIGREDFLKELRMSKVGKLMEPSKSLDGECDRLKKNLEKNYLLLKGYYEKSVEIQGENPIKAKALDELASSLADKMEKEKQELEEIEKKIVENRVKGIDYDIFKDIQKALFFIKKRDLEEFESSMEKKIEFTRTYIKKIKISFKEKETKAFHQQIMGLRKMIKKAGVRDLYETVFRRRDHRKLRIPAIVLGFTVEFVNNYEEEIEMLYNHKNPETVQNYHLGGKVKLLTRKVK